jgi:hypothetical protein
VSSQYEVLVEEVFPNVVIIDVNKSAPDTDMINYIKTEVYKRKDYSRPLGGEYPDLEKRLIKILCDKAGGIYDEFLDYYLM